MKALLSGIVIESRPSDDKGKTRITIATSHGQFKFASKEVDLSKIPQLIPVTLEMELSSILYNGNMYLQIDSVSVKKDGHAAASAVAA